MNTNSASLRRQRKIRGCNKYLDKTQVHQVPAITERCTVDAPYADQSLIDARQESCVETSLTFHNIPEKNAPSTYTITSSYASIDSMETNLTELIKTTQVKRKERNRKNEKKHDGGNLKKRKKV